MTEINTCSGLKRVVIDGERYVAESTRVSDATLKALCEAYGIAFSYGSYDPDTNPAHLRKIFDCLAKANEELKFKE